MKGSPPVVGFNNNLRYKGKVFHIQTEDSGVLRPHIITHLFTDDGRIIKTVKTSYADQLDSPAIEATVRQMMKVQHAAMASSVRDGLLDAVIPWGDAPLSGATSAGMAPAPSKTLPGFASIRPPVMAEPSVRATSFRMPPIAPNAPASSKRTITKPLLGAEPSAPVVSAPRAARASQPTTSLPSTTPRSMPPSRSVRPDAAGPEITTDVLERAAVAARVPSVAPPPAADTLPPPPASLLLKAKPEGAYRSIAPPPPSGAGRSTGRSLRPPAPSPQPPPPDDDAAAPGSSQRGGSVSTRAGRGSRSSPRPPASVTVPSAPRSSGGSRKSSPRPPASVTTTSSPKPQAPYSERMGRYSLLGETARKSSDRAPESARKGALSEINKKPLDEVILGYLAEDAEADATKKK